MPVDEFGALVPGSIVAGYEIRRKLGQGGFGIAYEGYNRDLAHRAAIKEYFPHSLVARQGAGVVPRSASDRTDFAQFLDRFVAEARALNRLDHPSIVKVRHLERANGTAYVIMDFIEGGSLAGWLAENGRALDDQTFRRFFEPLLSALAYVHGQNLLHRDISPVNIMVDSRQGPVLIDFGAFKEGWVQRPGRSTVIVANPAFAAPEQLLPMPGAEHGPFTDLFALAATMYFVLSGAPPEGSPSRAHAKAISGSDPIEPLANAARVRCSRRVLDAIERALRLNARERPQTVADFAEALGWIVARQQRAPLPTTYVTSPTLSLGGIGTAELRGTPRDGSHSIVLRATLGGRDVAIKLPKPGAQHVDLARSTLSGGRETFHSTDLWQAGDGGWAVPASLHYQLLKSELQALQDFGPHWNSGAIGVAMIAAQELPPIARPARDKAWPGLVMPYWEGHTLASVPADGRLDLFRRMLPALWQALSGRLHGNLSPDNLLLAPDRRLFRLLDPAPATLNGDSDGLDRTESFFETTPRFYPLIAPFAGRPDAGRAVDFLLRPGGAEVTPQQWHGVTHILGDVLANPSVLLRQASPTAPSDRPFPADQQALGLMLYHLATGRTLFVPNVIPRPAWATVLSSRGGTFDSKGYEAVQRAVAGGYLDDRLGAISDPGLASLVGRMVRCEVASVGELMPA